MDNRNKRTKFASNGKDNQPRVKQVWVQSKSQLKHETAVSSSETPKTETPVANGVKVEVRIAKSISVSVPKPQTMDPPNIMLFSQPTQIPPQKVEKPTHSFNPPQSHHIRNSFTHDNSFQVLSHQKKQQESYRRVWLHTHKNTENHPTFKVVTYNVLADTAAFEHKNVLYRSIDVNTLDWSFRFRVLAQELISENGDVICLQEVDHYNDFEKFLGKFGFAGVYKQRTGENKDGCAVFWNVNKFELLESKFIEYRKDQFMDRDNVAIIAVFAYVGDKNKKFIVGNTHILFNPARGDIKLGQVKCLVEEAEKISAGKVPVLLCGDFNCTPESPMAEYISAGSLDIMELNMSEVSGQNVYKRPKIMSEIALQNLANDGIMTHSLELSSAYDHSKHHFISSLMTDFAGSVDYIWHTPHFKLLGIKSLPEMRHLRSLDAMPNAKYASDHFSCVAEFAL